MLHFATKTLFIFLILTSFIFILPKDVAASITWEKEPFLTSKNLIEYDIKKTDPDKKKDLRIVLYIDNKPVDVIHCTSFTDFCRTSNNKGGALSLPSAFYPGAKAVVKVCEGSGGNNDVKKWNCDGKPLILEASVDISTAKGNLGTPGANPCTVTKDGGSCPTALGNIPTNPQDFVSKILNIGIGLGGGFAFILMVIGSIRVLTSSGDQQKLSGGRDMIVAAIAGLLFIVFSTLILRFIGISILGI